MLKRREMRSDDEDTLSPSNFIVDAFGARAALLGPSATLIGPRDQARPLASRAAAHGRGKYILKSIFLRGTLFQPSIVLGGSIA